jgi:hypothetical protein
MCKRDTAEFLERDDFSVETRKAILHNKPIDIYRLKF